MFSYQCECPAVLHILVHGFHRGAEHGRYRKEEAELSGRPTGEALCHTPDDGGGGT